MIRRSYRTSLSGIALAFFMALGMSTMLPAHASANEQAYLGCLASVAINGFPSCFYYFTYPILINYDRFYGTTQNLLGSSQPGTAVQVLYDGNIYNTNGDLVPEGSSVSAGTVLTLSFELKTPQIGTWGSAGYVGGLITLPAVGHWESGSNATPVCTSAGTDYSFQGTPLYGYPRTGNSSSGYTYTKLSNVDYYMRAPIAPPAESLSNLQNLTCGALTNGKATCTVTTDGPISATFNFAATTGHVYYSYTYETPMASASFDQFSPGTGSTQKVTRPIPSGCFSSVSTGSGDVHFQVPTLGVPNIGGVPGGGSTGGDGPDQGPVSMSIPAMSVVYTLNTTAPNCPAGSSGSTSGTWQYSESDHTDLQCSVQGSGTSFKPYSQFPNCAPPDPTGTSCTNGGSYCKTNVTTGSQGDQNCYVDTTVYQCITSGSSGGDGGSCPVLPLAATCSPSTPTANSGQSVTWLASPSGGSGNSYAYNWSGTDGLSGSSATVSKSYTNAGTKTASVTVTSGSDTVTVPCTGSVIVGAPGIDLTAGNVTPTTATAGTATTFSAPIYNDGSGATPTGFATLFQVATDADGTGATDMGTDSVRALAGGDSDSASLGHAFSEGTYYLRACADKNAATDTGVISETNENNNCGDWIAVTVAKPACYGAGCGPQPSCYTSGTCACTDSDLGCYPTPQPPQVTCSAAREEINLGDTDTLRWTSIGADSCKVNGTAASCTTNCSSSVTPTDTPTSNYAITCSNTGGNFTCPLQIQVDQPAASITANPVRVQKGSNSTITWTSVNATSCVEKGPGLSMATKSGSKALPIAAQSTYTITCQTPDGPQTDSVTVNINGTFNGF